MHKSGDTKVLRFPCGQSPNPHIKPASTWPTCLVMSAAPGTTRSKTQKITTPEPTSQPSYTSSSILVVLQSAKMPRGLSKSGHGKIVARMKTFHGMDSAARITGQIIASLAVSRVSLSWIEPRPTTRIKVTAGLGLSMVVVLRHRHTSRAALLQRPLLYCLLFSWPCNRKARRYNGRCVIESTRPEFQSKHGTEEI